MLYIAFCCFYCREIALLCWYGTLVTFLSQLYVGFVLWHWYFCSHYCYVIVVMIVLFVCVDFSCQQSVKGQWTFDASILYVGNIVV